MGSFLINHKAAFLNLPLWMDEIQSHVFLRRVEGLPQEPWWVVAIAFQPLWPLFFADLNKFGRVFWLVTDGPALKGPYFEREWNPKSFALSQKKRRQDGYFVHGDNPVNKMRIRLPHK